MFLQPTQSAHILVVDDTPEHLDLLEKMLTEQGYSVNVIAPSPRLIAEAKADFPDLILINALKSNSKGYTLCKKLQKDKKLGLVPIILIAPNKPNPSAIKSLPWEGIELITQPLEIEAIINQIRMQLKLKHLQAQLQEQQMRLQEETRFREVYENQLKNSEKFNQYILDSVSIGIGLTDEKGYFVKVNPAYCEIYGFQISELMGKHFTVHFPQISPQVKTDLIRQYNAFLASNTQYQQGEAEVVRKDGKVIIIEYKRNLFQQDDGQVFVVTTIQDITHRIQAEKSLRQQEQKFRALVEASQDMIWSIDLQGRYTFVNPAVEQIYGYRPEEMIGKLFTYFLAPEHLADDLTIFQRLLKGESIFHYESVNLAKNGTSLHLLCNAVPLKDEHGCVIGITGSASNITQRKRVEEELREAVVREKAISTVLQKMRETLDISTIFTTTTAELRNVIECERVAVYRFNPDWSGQFVCESVASELYSLLAEQKNNIRITDNLIEQERCELQPLVQASERVEDTYFQVTKGGAYVQGVRYSVVEDIYTAGFTPCYINLLEQLQVRAYIIVPIFYNNKLWGLLAAYQSSCPRQWKDAEINIMAQIGNQLGVALQQADLLEHAKQQSEALKKAAYAADAANQAKSEFLANMSHELRTPLNAILGFTQMMIRDSSLSSEQQENLTIINRSGEHLLSVINDILEMSKIEAGKITLTPKTFDFFNFLEHLKGVFHFKATTKGLQLNFEIDSRIPKYISSDENKLRQILINLLGNAIKFTEQGRVTLSVAFKDSPTSVVLQNPKFFLSFVIEDTGLGIAPQELHLLFEAFGQTETGRKSQQGTGLGLAISRKFIQLMGGDIQVQSKLGKGTRFTFDILVEFAENIGDSTRSPQLRVMGIEQQSKYRILVVDDQPESRRLLVQLLGSVGFSVQDAGNGQDAVEIWKSWKPHLILMDMRMPVMDGYEATQLIKTQQQILKIENQDDVAANTVIIAFTASAFEEQQKAILSAGCDDFLGKPFREEVLFEKLSQHLGITYVYHQDKSEQFSEAQMNLEISQSHHHLKTRLSEMPSYWVKKLQYAASQGSDDLILQLAEQLPNPDPFLTEKLITLANNFQFDVILNLINS